ncbi:double-stranded RNA-binding protein 4-like [Humulus lupulus]|uniref:double-stranded RNA-binding protein 4-like n=1 Tax=Humulus lupulus TaxID=3486 RepID=UPI002B40FEC4|nr:double-stranded RNA-binding protein 4-like [Humulus lupulus]
MFAASVTVNDEAFRVPATFNTKKEAMNDVARIAYGFLSVGKANFRPSGFNGGSSSSSNGSRSPYTSFEKDVSWKNILQERLRKMNWSLPRYYTKKSGPDHYPTFISRVEVEGRIFEGVEEYSKKLAERSAVKAVWVTISIDKLYEERRLRNKAYRLSKEARDLLLDLLDLIYKLTKTRNLANEHMKGIETVVENMNNQLSMAGCLNLDNVD